MIEDRDDPCVWWVTTRGSVEGFGSLFGDPDIYESGDHFLPIQDISGYTFSIRVKKANSLRPHEELALAMLFSMHVP